MFLGSSSWERALPCKDPPKFGKWHRSPWVKFHLPLIPKTWNHSISSDSIRYLLVTDFLIYVSINFWQKYEGWLPFQWNKTETSEDTRVPPVCECDGVVGSLSFLSAFQLVGCWVCDQKLLTTLSMDALTIKPMTFNTNVFSLRGYTFDAGINCL